MDIKPTRSNLLITKEKLGSHYSILSILKARRAALIKELLSSIEPFLKSREEIRKIFSKAIFTHKISLSADGSDYHRALENVNKREFPVRIVSNNIYGLSYREIECYENIFLKYSERKYSPQTNSYALEESLSMTELVIDEIIKLTNYENKLKVITEEVIRLSRKIKILEDKLIPQLRHKIKEITDYLNERERENYFRLKLYKNKKL